jgi:predicted RNA-binding Zn-ribbon protein involved in translation (DUF1610 family)
MSSLPEKIEVTCPKCGESYGDWQRPSLEPATVSKCPHCGYELAQDRNMRQDGAWAPAIDDLDEEER